MNNFYACLYRPLPVQRGAVVKIVAYYTNEAYHREAIPLFDSLERFKLYYEINHLAIRGGWLEAVLRKPRFILDQLRATAADAILYTDADSELRQKPDWELFKDADVSWHRFSRGEGHPHENLTGTMWFRNTPDVRSFVEDWATETELPQYRNHFTPEQESLRVTFDLKPVSGQLWSSRVRYVSMPPAMCWFDDCREVYGEQKPIVFHRQASRKHRHLKEELREEEASA